MRLLLLALAISLVTTSQCQTSPANDITVVCLLVNDHDEAIAWYTEKLGFQVKQDMKYGENNRWVTLLPREGGLELSLGLAKTREDSLVVGRQGGSYPFFVLVTQDVSATYESMKAQGVEFKGEPKRGPGGMGVTFRDLYGNVIYLRGR